MLSTIKLISLPALALFLGFLWSLETVVPLFSHPINRSLHLRRNLTLALVNFVVNTLVGAIALKMLLISEQLNGGILHMLNFPDWLKIIAGILIVDFLCYAWHVLTHHISFLWKFHQVHHTDTFLDVSTSLRHHPVDGVFQLLAQTPVLFLLGVSPFSYLIYYLLASPWAMFVHANVKSPGWLEKYGSILFVTPNWHKIHHSMDIQFTNSHYGAVFSIWDRLFCTSNQMNVEVIKYGLEYFRKDNFQRVKELLLMPFRK